MFFFIAGIQPKTVDLEDRSRICPSCGLSTARLKRIDHYVSVFFLPLFRIKKGRTFLACQRCGSLSGESGEVFYDSAMTRGTHCPSCGRSLEKTFQFCPYCGKRIA